MLDLTQELAKAGTEVTLLTGDDRDAPAAWRAGEAGCPRVVTIDRALTPTLRPKHSSGLLRDLVETVDLIHLHEAWDPFHPAIAHAARQAGKPYVVSVHGMLDDWCMASKAFKKRVYLQLVGRRLLEGAGWIHFTNREEANQSLRHVSGATPFFAPLVIDTESFRVAIGPDLARREFETALLDDGLPRLLFLGRLQAIKGLPLLIDALAKLHASGVKVPHLLIAGPAEENHDAQLVQQAASAGLAERVHLLGMVNSEMKRSLYEATDAFVLASHHENFGIALVEAMMCGMPVLTSKQVGIWQEVEQLGGLVVDHTVDSFAGGIQRLLAELPTLREQARTNRAAVFDWLEPTRVAARFLAGYEAAVGREKPPEQEIIEPNQS